MFKECPAFLGMLLPVKFVSGLDSMHLYIATSCSTKNICMRAYKNTFIWSGLTVDLGYMFWVTTYVWSASVLKMNGFKKVNSWQHFNPGSLWFELPVLWSLSKNYTRHQSVLTILCMDTYYTKLFTPPFKYLPNVCLFTTETRYSEAIPPIRVSTLIQKVRDPLHVCLLPSCMQMPHKCPTNALSYCFIAHNAVVSTTIFPTLTTESTHCNI